MGNFSRGPKSFAKKFGSKSFSSGSKNRDERDGESRGRSTMHDATCSSCGKDCQVPFRPTGSRPIFCSICFDKQGNKGSEEFGEKSYGKPRFGDKRKREFQKENAVFDTKNAEHLKMEFSKLHAKLDTILHALETRAVSTPVEIDLEESGEKAPFKMKTKVVGAKKTTKKK